MVVNRWQRRSLLRGGIVGVSTVTVAQVSARLGPVAGTTVGLAVATAAASAEPLADQWRLWRRRRRGSDHQTQTCESELETFQRKLEQRERGVNYWRSTSVSSPDRATRSLAYELCELAETLAELGRPHDAIESAAEAVDRFRVLARAWPAVFNASLAYGLDQLSRHQYTVGHHLEAQRCSSEAVDLLRARLSDLSSESREAEDAMCELAIYLQDLSNRHRMLGRNREAALAAEEAVMLFSSPIEPDPARLGSALATLASHRLALGRHEEALPDATAAVRWLKLGAAHGANVTRDLSFALGTMGWILCAVGRHQEAIPCARRAVETERAEVEKLPGVRERNLVWALRCLVEATKPSDPDEALSLTEEAQRVARAWAAGGASATRSLAEALGCRADVLAQLGRHEEALLVYQQAEAAWRELEADDPVAYAKQLAMEQYNVAAALGRLQLWDEAVDQASVAVDSFVELAEEDFDAHAGSLAEALFARAAFLANEVSPAEAAPDFLDAAHCAREAAKRNPRLFARLDVFISEVRDNLRQAGVPEAAIHEMMAEWRTPEASDTDWP